MIDANLIVGILLGIFLIGFACKLYVDEKIWSKKIDNILKGHK